MAKATFLRQLREDKQRIEDFLSHALDDAVARAEQIDGSYKTLLEVAKKTTFAGGKRLRPILALLAYRGYNGKHIDEVVPVACAWELLHSGVLMHDDIIDRDNIRHNAVNVSGAYKEMYGSKVGDPQHFANASAMLAGVLLISEAQRIVIASSLKHEQQLAIVRLLNDALFLVAGGELLDYESAFSNLGQSDPRKIAMYKTASYSVTLPLTSGALLAGAPDSELSKLEKLGDTVGIAFQLVDDLIGVFGDPKKTGKSVDVDIRERKHTLLVQETFALLSADQKAELTTLYSGANEMTTRDVAMVRRLMDESGAKQAVEDEVVKRHGEAVKIIDSLAMVDQEKANLTLLVEMLLNREA